MVPNLTYLAAAPPLPAPSDLPHAHRTAHSLTQRTLCVRPAVHGVKIPPAAGSPPTEATPRIPESLVGAGSPRSLYCKVRKTRERVCQHCSVDTSNHHCRNARRPGSSARHRSIQDNTSIDFSTAAAEVCLTACARNLSRDTTTRCCHRRSDRVAWRIALSRQRTSLRTDSTTSGREEE